jgi:putative hydrolase of the HAD superfamily
MIDVIAFDGDDTLWHSEDIYSVTQERFRAVLRRYRSDEEIDATLLATERRNLRIFGYGVKGFILSMVDTAIEISEGQISARDIQAIISLGREMLIHPVRLVDGARETLEALTGHRLMLISKGDLMDQETKIAKSGLAELFWKIEIVSEKDEKTYHRILRDHNILPERFMMVGNSIRSDIRPVLTIGGNAVYIPFHITWEHERGDATELTAHFWKLESIVELQPLVERLASVQ